MAFLAPYAVPLLVGATALNAVGSYQRGQAQGQAADYNSAIARQNAEIARQQGMAAAEAQQRNAQRQMGSMIASYGASGVQSDTGSPLDVLADSARMAELDRLSILYNSEMKARGYNQQSNLYSLEGDNARTSGVLGMFGSAAQGYATGKQLGVF